MDTDRGSKGEDHYGQMVDEKLLALQPNKSEGNVLRKERGLFGEK